MTTTTQVEDIGPVTREEAAVLAAEENRRVAALVASLGPDDWSRPTDCTAWDVRALVTHLLAGMQADISLREFVHQVRAARRAAGDGPFIDGLTAVGVADRAHLTPDEIVSRLVDAAPRAAEARRRVPGLLRRLPVRVEFAGTTETWRLGYLIEVIETRDAWMHRIDLCRATGRELVLTPDHDGRIVADVVAEWARRHGQPFALALDGPAGGEFRGGDGAATAETLSLDAVEFCRILSGRGHGHGLLARVEVPF